MVILRSSFIERNYLETPICQYKMMEKKKQRNKKNFQQRKNLTLQAGGISP